MHRGVEVISSLTAKRKASLLTFQQKKKGFIVFLHQTNFMTEISNS